MIESPALMVVAFHYPVSMICIVYCTGHRESPGNEVACCRCSGFLPWMDLFEDLETSL